MKTFLLLPRDRPAVTARFRAAALIATALLPATAGAQFTTGPVIRNPANGGTTPTDADFLATGAVTTEGMLNSIGSLTLDAGMLTLDADETLRILTGNVLARADTAGSAINGGTIDFLNAAGTFDTAGDLTVGSDIRGASLRKTGPGTLTVEGGGSYFGTTTTVDEGTLRAGAGSPFASQTILLRSGAAFDLNGIDTTIGGLAGLGTVNLGAGALTIAARRGLSVFSAGIAGTGSLVFVEGVDPFAIRALLGASTFSGGTVLDGGVLQVGHSQALGSGPLTVNGGVLRSFGTVTIANPVVLNADLVAGDGNLTLGAASGISGAHAIEMRGEGGLAIAVASAHTGETRTANGMPGRYTYAPGAITLAGAMGSVPATSALRIEGGGSLVLDDRVAFAGGPGGRIPDAAPIHLSSSSLQLTGNASAASIETAGSLHATGFSTVTVAPPGTAGAQLIAAELDRIERATLLFRGPKLGGAPGPGVANVTFTSPPAGLVGAGGTGPDVSILPYAIGDALPTGNGSGLVTYSAATGIRLLDPATEYAPVFAASATNNASVGGGQFIDSPTTVNALLLQRFSSLRTSGGGGTLAITSGTLLAAGGATIEVPVDFGSAEANIFAADNTLTIGGAVSGSGGLTKSGAGTLSLTGPNTFTGRLTINAGLLRIASLENLGADVSLIVINANGNGAGLQFGGMFPRDIEVQSGLARLDAQLSGSVSALAGAVTGAGGLRITGSGTVVLQAVNNYAGPTVVESGLAFSSDAALGMGGPVVLAGSNARVRLDGAWIADRPIELRGTATLDTNGFDATFSGSFVSSSNSQLNKIGDGALTISGENYFRAGTIAINRGSVRLAGSGMAPSVSIGALGTLDLDNSTLAQIDRLPDASAVAFAGGALRATGHASEPVTEIAGTLTSTGGGSITLLTPGSGSVSMLFAGYSATGGRLVFRGDNFSGGAGGPFSRVSFLTPPALVGGLLPFALAETVSTGFGDSFATYDPSADAGGVIGVRPLRDSEYATGGLIQNPAQGGTIAQDANFRVTGPAALGGSAGTVNSLTFSGTGNLGLAPGQVLTIGSSAVLTQRGASAVLSGGVLAFTGNRFAFHGDGDLAFGAAVSVPALGTIDKFGNGTLTLLDGANFPAGPFFNVSEGILQPGAGTGLRTSRVQLAAGGTLDLAGQTARIGSLVGSGAVALGSGRLVIGGYYFPSSDFAGSISGSGGIVVTENQKWILRSPSPYLGATAVVRDASKPGDFVLGGPSLFLADQGSILASGEYTGSAGTIELLNSSSVEDRIGPAPVALNGSTLRLRGHPTLASDESAGPLTVTGFSRMEVREGSSGANRPPTALRFTDLERQDRGTLSVGTDSSSRPLGDRETLGFSAALEARLVGAGTTATNRGILPFVISRDTSSAALTTFDPAVGVRPLMAAEYSSTLTAGDNVRLTGNAINASPITINSLTSGSVTGAGILTVSSGTILASGTISAPLSFGAAEGVVFNLPLSLLTLSGSISGSNGLTLSANGGTEASGIRLEGSNSFTGPLTVNGGTVRFIAADNFGADPSDIVINNATLEYAGAGALILDRGLRTNGWQSTLSSSGGALTLSGGISGPASVSFLGDVTLAGPNSYAGYTGVEGRLTFSGDAAFGGSPLIHLKASQPGGNSGVLKIAGPWATARDVLVEGSYDSGIDTNGFDAVLGGVLRSAATGSKLIKSGLGTLEIADASAFSGNLEIKEGRLEFNGALGNGSANVRAGGTLGGSGVTARGIAVNTGGMLDPGQLGTPAALTVGSTFLQAGSTAHFDLASSTSFDQAKVNGTLTLDGLVTLSLSLGYDPLDFVDSFLLFDNDGADPIAGNAPHHFAFGGLEIAENDLFIASGQEFRLTYLGGDGNDVVIHAVPEPGVIGMLAAGALGLGIRRSRLRRG